MKFLGTGLNTHLNTFSICDIEEPIHTVRFHKEPIKNNIYLKALTLIITFTLLLVQEQLILKWKKST